MKTLITLLVAVGLAVSVYGQQPAGGQNRPQPRGQGGPPGDPGQRLGVMAERLSNELKLDAAQVTKLNEIVKKHEQQMANAPGREERRKLMEEMQQARQAGDDAKVEELRTKMRELGGGAGGPGGPMNAFFDDVKGILRQDQLPKFEELRQAMVQRMGQQGPGGRGQNVRQTIADLRQELKLEPEQQKRFDELAAQVNQQPGQSPELQKLREEMQAAREANDQAKMQELQAKVQSLRGNPQTGLDKFYKDLEPILNDAQKAALKSFQQRAQGGQDNVRVMFRAVQRLEGLTDAQREQIRAIEREATDASRGQAISDTAARAEAAKKVKEQIKAILTPEQADQFEKALAQQNRPGRGGQGNRPGRGQPQPGEGDPK
jgi:Spy/CpxP family protein refolding chaperone